MVERVFQVCCVLVTLDSHDHGKDDTNNNRGNQPASVVDEPCEIEANLLSIIVFDDVDWLHIIQVRLCGEHTQRKTKPVLLPAIDDIFTLLGLVDWEVVSDYLTRIQVVEVTLALQGRHHNVLLLSAVKCLEHFPRM